MKPSLSPKAVKGLAGGVLLVGAIFASMGSGSPATTNNLVKHSGSKKVGAGAIQITFPETAKEYGPGTYVFEGQVGKGKHVSIALDDDSTPVLMDADADGAYRYEAKITKPGSHKVEVVVGGGEEKGKDFTEALEFAVDKAKKATKVATNTAKAGAKKSKDAGTATEGDLPVGLLPEDDQSDVKYPDNKSLGANDVALKDSATKEDTHAAATHSSTKPAGHKATTKAKDSVKPAAKFVLSSHTNFNVVPHGVIKIGGKGTPGDKIMLLVDGKPSMRGTVKVDGRWLFPVKVAKPGFRKITAQNLKTRAVATIKLKIK